MKRSMIIAAATALLAATAPAGAQAARSKLPDLAADEVAALAIYAVPGLIDATRQTCAARLSSTGFLAKRGDALARRYAAHQSSAWPQARSAMLKFAGSKADEQMKVFATLPDDAVRPLVDALIRQEAGARIKPASCPYVERLAEALSPLEPPQAGKVLAVLFDIASAGDELIARAGTAEASR